MRVEDIMTPSPQVVGPETSLREVAELLASHGISGIPVVENGDVLGVVSKSDIVEQEQQAESELVQMGGLLERFRALAKTHSQPRAKVEPRTAREAMSSPPLTVEPQVSAVGAAWLMTQHDVHRLPVVWNGRLVGMVTRTDLVRAFARSDAQIEQEIVEDVLPGLGLSSNDIAVVVKNGTVTLSGEVDDELDARCLPHAVRSVIGVIGVDSEVCARPPVHAGLS